MLNLSMLFKSKDNKSGCVAKDRLKLVLVHDRMNTSPELIESIRRDIMEVISKYVEIDLEEFDISIANSEEMTDSPIICANIPIKDIKRNV